MFTENAGAVRVVDIDHRVVTVGQREQPGQIGDVAVLAEHAVGDDDAGVGLDLRSSVSR